MRTVRAAWFVLFLASSAYANSLGNGFAYDDNSIIPQNPVVTSGDWQGALSSPYHPDALEGAGLYRPLTSLSFTLEWMAFADGPLGYHLLNLALHASVSLLIFLFLLEVGAIIPALVGASLFAVHPVHTEAVANVVGQAELYSALFFLAACLLFWVGGNWKGWQRVPRLLGLGFLYALSLGAKEIGVTLPVVLLLLEAFRPAVEMGKIRGGTEQGPSVTDDRAGESGPGPHWGSGSPLRGRLFREAPTFALLFVVLLAYLGCRWMVLGTLTGEVPAPTLQALGAGSRILTAVALWFQYLRLLVFPLDLVADYAPGVLFPSEGLDLSVFLGIATIVGVGYGVVRAVRAAPPLPLVALGVLWFIFTVLPVSNLLMPTGVLLAERTLYLPSVGLSLLAAGVTFWCLGAPRLVRRLVFIVSIGILLGFFSRTVHRNPAWFSTFVVLETLNEEHPESHLAILNRGSGLERMGDTQAAGDQFSMALRLVPLRYGTLTEVAGFYGRIGEWGQAEGLLRRAIEIAPARDDAYRLLSSQFLRQRRGREAHRVALAGLERAGSNGELWGTVSESYILKGDLRAALRARRVAVARDVDSGRQWARLAEILELLGEEEEAATARTRARGLQKDPGLAGAPPQVDPPDQPRAVQTHGGTTQ